MDKGLRSLLGAALLVAAVMAAGCASSSRPHAVNPTTTTVPATSPTAPSTTPATTPATGAPVTTTTTVPAVAGLGSYLPLFPFSSYQDVLRWQAAYRSGGQQPWHLDAGATSTAFAARLGYSGIDSVTSRRDDSRGAHVSIGFHPNGPGTTPVVAAVVHLVRWGSGAQAPWEGGGTDDPTLPVDRPVYGSTDTSPVTVGGVISGVDENIKVEVFAPTPQGPVGTACCQPAGGTGTPWRMTVTYSAPAGRVLTISASTGGHVAGVERFAVTGVRAG